MLLIGSLALAQNYVQTAMAIAATDLTNINKSEYKLYTDIPDFSNDLEGSNLCLDNNFAKHVDKFTCAKPITYVLTTNLDSADIILSNDKSSINKLVVCTEKSDNCDVVINKKVELNREHMNDKGFVPDPNHRW